MSANVESMMYVGETPWHGLGVEVEEAPTSEEAIKLAGLDWDVIPEPIYDRFGRELPGYKVNTRSSDNMALGIVTDRYKIVQNREAFAFTDELLGMGVRYETAGSLQLGILTLKSVLFLLSFLSLSLYGAASVFLSP